MGSGTMRLLVRQPELVQYMPDAEPDVDCRKPHPDMHECPSVAREPDRRMAV